MDLFSILLIVGLVLSAIYGWHRWAQRPEIKAKAQMLRAAMDSKRVLDDAHREMEQIAQQRKAQSGGWRGW